MKTSEVLQICKGVNEYLRKNKIYENVHPYGQGLPVIQIDIEWGDWKHEHLKVKWLMKNIGCPCISSVVTEEDGSDCYSATHDFLVEHDTINKLSEVA